MMVDKNVNLRKLSDDGYIGLTIRAWDTEYNESIHKAFRDFCKEEYRNDYTLGLKSLIESYNMSHQFGGLWKAINDIDSRLAIIEDSLSEDSYEEPASAISEEDDGVF